MASSPKKANRPAVKHEQPRPAADVVEPPVEPASDISVAALEAAEVLPPIVEPLAEPPAEILEAPAAEIELVAAVEAPPVVAEAAPAVASVAEPQVAQAPEPPAPPAPVVETDAPPVDPFRLRVSPAAVASFGDVRTLIEQGLHESRAKFAQVKDVARETSAAVEASYDAARDGVVALNVKTIEAIKAGANANFDFAVSLAGAKSVAEALSLQSDFARKRLDEASSQVKALADLARKVTDDTIAPIKAHVAKTFKIAV